MHRDALPGLGARENEEAVTSSGSLESDGQLDQRTGHLNLLTESSWLNAIEKLKLNSSNLLMLVNLQVGKNSIACNFFFRTWKHIAIPWQITRMDWWLHITMVYKTYAPPGWTFLFQPHIFRRPDLLETFAIIILDPDLDTPSSSNWSLERGRNGWFAQLELTILCGCLVLKVSRAS